MLIFSGISVTKAFKPEPALKGSFQAAFGSLSSIGARLMDFASPKSTHKTVPLRSQNFVDKGFFDVRGTKRSKSNGIYEYFNKAQRKILVSKSDSTLNALAMHLQTLERIYNVKLLC